MKKITLLIATFLLATLFAIPTFAAEKDYKVNIEKEYVSAHFAISFKNKGDYEVTITSPKDDIYEATHLDDGNMECTVNDSVPKGEWNVHVVKREEIVVEDPSEPVEEGVDDTEEVTEEEISGVKIEVKGSMEKSIDVTKELVVATDIAGLKIYFKDDNIVAEWTDTTCGNVDISVTNEKNNQKLDESTVKERYYELPLNPADVESVIVRIVPSVSSGIEGAEKQFIYKFDNHPDAIVTYEDIEITNKDSIDVHVVLNNSYSVMTMNNNKEIMTTELLAPGEYDFDLPTEVGDNNFLTYIIDEKHNMRSTSGYVEKDVIAPVLQLADVYENISTESASIVLEGKVEDYDTFTINDKVIFVEGDHTFKYDYGLKEGYNEIHVVASDKAGNVSEYIATVTRIIPVEKPVPWFQIIVGCLVVLVIVLYILEVLKKYRNGEEIRPQKNSKNSKSTKEKVITDYDKKRNRNAAIHEILNLVIPIAVIFVILKFVIAVVVIQSASMEPTLMTGNTVFVNRLAYTGEATPQRGDIVTFWSNEFGKYFGKRVIGVPGDVIEFKDGYVVINGQYTDESDYLDESVETYSLTNETFTVPDGSYFLLGDNRENSYDARYWASPYISADDILGKYMGQIDFSIQFDIIQRFF